MNIINYKTGNSCFFVYYRYKNLIRGNKLYIYIFLFILAGIYSIFSKSTLLIILLFCFIITIFGASINMKSLKKSIIIAGKGAEKGYGLIIIFSILGILSASWFLSGTIPALIYFGIKIINPQYFYISVFFILSIFSFLLGSCFGSVGTIGIVLLSLGKSLGMDLFITGGAIVSGSYFGDRSSPTSSSANFVSILTETNIYTNVKNMFKTGVGAYLLTSILYFYLGYNKENQYVDSRLIDQIPKKFEISYIVFLPLCILLFLCIIKYNVKKTMILSSLSALLLAVFYQKFSGFYILKSLVFGFEMIPEEELANIIKGGGIVSMATAVIMALLSCGMVKIFDETGILEKISNKIGLVKEEWKLYLYTAVTAIFTAGISSSQSTSILLTVQLMKKTYMDSGKTNEELAIDIENTSVVLSGLIPWCIGITVPATMLGMKPLDLIPWSFYLYLIPFVTILSKFIFKRKNVNNPLFIKR